MTSLSKTIQFLESGIQNNLHQGAQLAISLRGKLLESIALGNASADHPMTSETLNLWLSSTKPITAVLLAQLQEKNILSWNDPISRFIPEFAQRGKESMTLWHLLTHTGGFRGADAMWNPEPWEKIINRICATPLEPRWIIGEKAGYHISGSWFILGEVLQRITQRPFQDYVREELFLPLAMKDCWIGMTQQDFDRYPTQRGEIEVTEKQPAISHPHFNSPEAWFFCRPASNGRGPMKQLLHFYEMISNQGTFEGKRVLRPETVHDLTTRHRVGMFDHSFRQTIDWGLGFIHDSKENEGGHLVYGFGPHATRETIGHSGSQSSSAFLDRTHGLAVAWFCNGMPGEILHQKRAYDLNSRIYEDLGLI